MTGEAASSGSFDQPYVGTLEMPDKVVAHGTSVVTAEGDRVIAQLRWHLGLVQRFEVLDASGATQLGEGGAEGFRRRRYSVRTPSGAPIVTLELGMFGPLPNKMRAALPDGKTYDILGLGATGIYDTPRHQIASIERPNPHMSLRVHSMRMHVREPSLTLLQAIGLAQCIRAVARRHEPSK